MSTKDNRSAPLVVHAWRKDAYSNEERFSLRKPGVSGGGPDFHGLKAVGFRAGEEVVVISRERYERLLALEQLL